MTIALVSVALPEIPENNVTDFNTVGFCSEQKISLQPWTTLLPPDRQTGSVQFNTKTFTVTYREQWLVICNS